MQRWSCCLQSAKQQDWRHGSSPTDSYVKEDTEQDDDKPPAKMHKAKDREVCLCFWSFNFGAFAGKILILLLSKQLDRPSFHSYFSAENKGIKA